MAVAEVRGHQVATAENRVHEAATAGSHAHVAVTAKSHGHEAMHVLIDEGQCIGCAVCVDVCTSAAFVWSRESLVPAWLAEKCSGCGTCEHECPTGAIRVNGKTLAGAGK